MNCDSKAHLQRLSRFTRRRCVPTLPTPVRLLQLRWLYGVLRADPHKVIEHTYRANATRQAAPKTVASGESARANTWRPILRFYVAGCFLVPTLGRSYAS